MNIVVIVILFVKDEQKLKKKTLTQREVNDCKVSALSVKSRP